jgi:hypothetical protein
LALSVRLRVCLIVSLLVATLLPAWPTTAAAASGQLSGVVRDHEGRAQVGADVVLFDPAGARVGTGTTGSAGRYSFSVPAGVYELAVLTHEPIERLARVASVAVGAATALDVVVLPPYVTLSGTVRDAAGFPLGRNVKVEFGWYWAQTDDQGRYSLTTRAGTAPLSISMRGSNGQEMFRAGVEEFDLTGDRALDLTLGFAPLSVRLLDERGGPLPNGRVWASSPKCEGGCRAGFELFPGSGPTTASSSVAGDTDAQGTASIITLAVDQVVSAATAAPGFLPAGLEEVSYPWSAPVAMVQRDAPPPAPIEPPPAMVTWTGVLRHNGSPVDGSVGGDSTDNDGRFALQLPPGRHQIRIRADIGRGTGCDSGGCGDQTSIIVPDVELTTDRTMDVDIPTTRLDVQVVDQQGNPTWALASGRSGGDSGAQVEVFPGGIGLGGISDVAQTDAAGHARLLMFPGSPPPVVSVSQNGGTRGSARVAASATSVTVQFSAVTLSGTVRDARGPLPLANDPWVSFSGRYDRNHRFDGDSINPDGAYALQVMPGRHTLTISDEPEFDESDTDDHAVTATLPKVWTIRTDLDLDESTTLDLTIPDASPAHFRAVGADGHPFPAHFNAYSQHTIDLGSGLSGAANTESHDRRDDGRFEHMLFDGADTSGAIRLVGDDWDTPTWGFTVPHLEPGDEMVLAVSSSYSGGDILPVPATTTTTTAPAETTTTTRPARPGDPDPGTGPAASEDTESGYWALSADGRIFNFGAADLGHTSPGAIDLEPSPTGKGYWSLNRNGTVQPFGDATRLGDVNLAELARGEEPTALSATPSGKGYWVFTNRGRVLPFGDAPFLGDMSRVALNGPVLDSVATPSGAGYWMVASDGGIFTFGDATFAGSMGGHRLNQPVMSMAADSDGSGYWLVASDGGIFAFDATFHGSMGGTPLNRPVSGMVPGRHGYLMVAEDGGIFAFGDVPFHGSLGADPPGSPVIAVALRTALIR